jgi:ribonuclease P protein component
MTPDRPALHTLRVRREFLAVAKGDKQVRRGLVLQARQRDVNAKTDLDAASDPTSDADTAIRFGLTATKKIGNAVIRNRTRRRLRVLAHEILSAHGQPGYDYVLIGRAATKHRTWDGLRTDLRSALKKLHKTGNKEE